ncbi:MAG: MFS transporter [Spirochaetia bacterium]|nr:MFS transporter [Spirochaetia bacterium]
MVILYSSFFFLYAIYAVVNPFLQVMLRNLGYSHEMVGHLLSLFEISGIIGPLLLARWVDKQGNMKRAVLLCTIGTVVSMSVLMVSSSFLATAVSLIVLAYFFRALLPLLDTYANNLFDGNAQRYAMLRSFGTVGFVFFSVLFAITGRPNLESNVHIGLYAIGTSIFFIIPVFFWKREPKRQKVSSELLSEPEGRWYDAAFIVGMLIIALIRLSMASLTSFFSLYLVEELEINAISLMNAIAAGSEYGAMIFAGIMIQRKKVLPVQLLMISSAGMVVRLLIYAFFPSFTGVLVAQLMHSFCYGFFHPAAIYFVARRVKRSHRALGMSIYVSLGNGLPAVVGSSLGGIVVEYLGYAPLFSSYSLFAFAAFVLCIIFYKRMTIPPLEAV